MGSSDERLCMLRNVPGSEAYRRAKPDFLTRWLAIWGRPIGLATAVGIAYFAAARMSLELLSTPDGVAVFWPAAGVAAGLVIGLGKNARWPVVVGTMAATVVANIVG